MDHYTKPDPIENFTYENLTKHQKYIARVAITMAEFNMLVGHSKRAIRLLKFVLRYIEKHGVK
jgi:hypothetical protein